jgi:ABC-2 type transport system permease protein
MNKSITRVFVLTKRNFKEIVRNPISLVFIIGLPLIMEILFYILFHSMTSQFQMRYLAPGIVVFSQAFLSLFMGQLIAIDKSTSFLTRLYVSKAKSHEFIISYALSLIPFVFIQAILFFLIGILFDISMFKIELISSIVLSLFTSFLFLGLGILFGTLCNERSVGGVASIIISAQSLLSGMWFPTEGLDGTMIRIMNYLPFKNATILIQNSLNGINDLYNDFIFPLLMVLIYTIVVFSFSIYLYRLKMKVK